MRVAVVLAAGRASRFGDQKLVADYRGVPLVRRAVENVLASSVERVCVVVGYDADAVEEAVAGLGVSTVRTPEPDDGMSSSIRVGVEAASGAEAVLVVLGDQPEVGPGIVNRVLEADPDRDADVVVPVYRGGVPANPVLFRSPVFPELLALEGDGGARSVVERTPDRVKRVAMDRPVPRDVDTRADLRRLEQQAG